MASRDGVGDEFQQRTKHVRGRLEGKGLDWSNKPEAFKSYPLAERIALPAPAAVETSSVREALSSRRSVREFRSEPLTLEELSFLLWASTGIRERQGRFTFRTAPSAGALYPIETYVVINNVYGPKPGLFHYDIRSHALEVLKHGDVGGDAASGALDQDMCAYAPVVFIWTGVFERSKWKYGQRAYRYVYMDAGHIAGNLALAAASMGLGSCQIAATYDDEVNALLGIDGIEESVVYLSVVGRPASL